MSANARQAHGLRTPCFHLRRRIAREFAASVVESVRERYSHLLRAVCCASIGYSQDLARVHSVWVRRFAVLEQTCGDESLLCPIGLGAQREPVRTKLGMSLRTLEGIGQESGSQS